jgi:hypothetical protein
MKSRIEILNRLTFMHCNQEESKAEIADAIQFLKEEDLEGNKDAIAYLQECSNQIDHEQGALESAIRRVAQ